jgi:ribosomal protein S18 acetylase RimI-like enzyme
MNSQVELQGTLEIDRANFGDRLELFALECQCFDQKIRFSRQQLSYLLKSPRVEIYVMRNGGQIIAEAIFLKRKTKGGEVARLYSLAVKPEYRGRGYSKQLLGKSLAALRQQNILMIYLEVETENRTAIGLYQSLGFAPVKLLKDYYQPTRDGLKMKLNLA